MQLLLARRRFSQEFLDSLLQHFYSVPWAKRPDKADQNIVFRDSKLLAHLAAAAAGPEEIRINGVRVD